MRLAEPDTRKMPSMSVLSLRYAPHFATTMGTSLRGVG